MEQKSNVRYRAEKEYKNSREKFFLLLREIISNSLHAVLIRASKDDNYIPQLDLDIRFDDSQCSIELRDNGEGFTKVNRECFEELDMRNPEKEKFHFHPLGQGRLAIVYFSDSAKYETVYKSQDDTFKKRIIPYPDVSHGLFEIDGFQEQDSASEDTYTKLTIAIRRYNTLSRAKTFFRTHNNIESIKQWFVETFFPFIITNEQLSVNVSFNGDFAVIKKDNIESETKIRLFDVTLSDDSIRSFKLWLIKTDKQMQGDNGITCFARNLRAELANGRLTYAIDNEEGYLLYLTSDYFDECVDTKGEIIEISSNDILEINKTINELLDVEFESVIAKNKQATKRNLQKFKKQFPSLGTFVNDEHIMADKKIIKEKDIVQSAIEEKGRIEKYFWTHIDNEIDNDEDAFGDSDDCQKLLNSSLHIYVKHRESVLKRLHTLIQKFDDEGVDKPELESTVHELFIKRGTTLNDSSNINHLHNLWILDDKFTTFSNDFKAKSTKPGQALSDVYIWADDPERTKQILIFELKSTTKAYNAGSREEGMIAQVKRYAQDFYKSPTQTLNWHVNTDKIQYTGIILARKSDINKELVSPNVSGGYHQIPFLEDSYYYDDEFSKSNSPKDKMPIRIELYSFEDIYMLAHNRNNVFFKLLRQEFELDKAIE